MVKLILCYSNILNKQNHEIDKELFPTIDEIQKSSDLCQIRLRLKLILDPKSFPRGPKLKSGHVKMELMLGGMVHALNHRTRQAEAKGLCELEDSFGYIVHTRPGKSKDQQNPG